MGDQEREILKVAFQKFIKIQYPKERSRLMIEAEEQQIRIGSKQSSSKPPSKEDDILRDEY